MNSKRLVIPYPDDEVQRRIEEKQVYQEYLHEEGRDPEEVKNQVFAALGELKDQRIRQIFELRYLQSKKMIWQKIAKKIGTSPQTVMALHRKGINLIRNKITEEENREQLVESI
jgi:DNA-directed RNA polymerase specialized sigma subunit